MANPSGGGRLLRMLAARLSRRAAAGARGETAGVATNGSAQCVRGYASAGDQEGMLVGSGASGASGASGSVDAPAPAPARPREPETPLLRSIRNRIMIRGGPLTLAEYMSEVLTNPLTGYYTSAGGEAGGGSGGLGSSSALPPAAAADSASAPASLPPSSSATDDAAAAPGRSVFGARGDFVTSPEISQLFGEMICIWSLALWLSQGRPPRVRLVELGPGRGTLMADALRSAAGSFPAFAAAVRDVRLVELSPVLREAQWRALRCENEVAGGAGAAATASEETAAGGGGTARPPPPPPRRGISRLLGGGGRDGVPVTWHASLDEVPGRVRVRRDEGGDDSSVAAGSGLGGGGGRRRRVASASAGTAKTEETAADETEFVVETEEDGADPYATIYIAHEFFDALPVHQFQYAPARKSGSSSRSKTDSAGGGGGLLVGGGGGAVAGAASPAAAAAASSTDDGCWLERMVDIVPDDDPSGLHLRFVLSPSPTPAAALLVPRRLAALSPVQRAALRAGAASSSSSSAQLPTQQQEQQTQQVPAIEISAHGMALAEALALRVGASPGGGGGALVVDYGRAAPYGPSSLTAVRAHAQHPHPLSRPGEADLSAWVDFSALAQAAEESGAPVRAHGPVSQGEFLGALGARERAEALAVTAADAAAGAAEARGFGREEMEREARRAAEAVAEAYRRLVGGGAEGMGETYKAFAIVPRGGARGAGGRGGGGAPVGFGGGVGDGGDEGQGGAVGGL